MFSVSNAVLNLKLQLWTFSSLKVIILCTMIPLRVNLSEWINFNYFNYYFCKCLHFAVISYTVTFYLARITQFLPFYVLIRAFFKQLSIVTSFFLILLRKVMFFIRICFIATSHLMNSSFVWSTYSNDRLLPITLVMV